MNTDDLEALLSGAQETPQLDFKAPMEWNVRTFAKDILAMANNQDGGAIVIGVDDGAFTRRGTTAEQIASYNIDAMRDQMGEYADPFVQFSVSFPQDAQQLIYVVIEVSTFEDLPVICRKDGHDTARGSIYCRSKTQKPQSARVSNSTDMRDILDLAVARRMRKLRHLGLIAESQGTERLDQELEGL